MTLDGKFARWLSPCGRHFQPGLLCELLEFSLFRPRCVGQFVVSLPPECTREYRGRSVQIRCLVDHFFSPLKEDRRPTAAKPGHLSSVIFRQPARN